MSIESKGASVKSSVSSHSSNGSLQDAGTEDDKSTEEGGGIHINRHVVIQRQAAEEDDRFATIRPKNVIARQQQEHKPGADRMHDQLMVYKRMRQSHQRQLEILESKLRTEMNDHRRQLDKEYEQVGIESIQ